MVCDVIRCFPIVSTECRIVIAIQTQENSPSFVLDYDYLRYGNYYLPTLLGQAFLKVTCPMASAIKFPTLLSTITQTDFTGSSVKCV